MNLGWITATVARVVSVIRAEQIRTSYAASPKSAVNCDLLCVQWSNIGVLVGDLMQSIRFSGYL